MALVLKYLFNTSYYYFSEYEDTRVSHLPLVGSPFTIFAIIGFYLFIVKNWGPKFMAIREPFDLKYTLRVYNALQVIVNVFIFYFAIKNSYMQKGFSLTCQPVDTTNNKPYIKQLLIVSYCYYINKYVDLLDTIFFVLRKKNKQITFLHVYHHAGMIFAVYIFMKFLAGSHSTFLGVLNSLVHVLMYSYYFLTSMNSKFVKSLWWKKKLTQLQLLQFGMLTIHYGLILINNWCNHSILIAFLGFSQSIFMFLLFADFYYKTYIKVKSS